jgi:methyl-accepting chemotaxis protein
MKNLSITKKMLLINTPAMIALIILSLIFIFMTNSVNNITRQTLYDELYVPTAALLNADRDFYQAYVAEDEIALLKASQSASDQAKTYDGLITGFLDKAKQELTLLSTQEPAPRPSEQLEKLVADFSDSAQKEIESLNTQGYALRPSQSLESLVTDFSKNAQQELALLKSQNVAARPSETLENLVADFSQNAESKLAQLSVKNSISDASQLMESLAADFSENATQAKTRMDDAFTKIQANADLYENYQHPTAGVTLKKLHQEFTVRFDEWFNTNPVTSDSTDTEKHLAAFNAAREQINLMTELLEAYAQGSTTAIAGQIANSTVSSIVIVAVIAVLLTLLAIYVIHYLKKNVLYITGISKRIAQGELQLAIDEKTFARDEIGQLSKAMGQILYKLGEYHNYIAEIASVLDAMKQGEMAIRLNQAYEGEFAAVKTALLGISSSLSDTLSNINIAAEHVSTGAAQVANGAQALAAGSSEQASSIEELSISVTKVAGQAKDNSVNVKAATQYVDKASADIRDGSEHMSRLTGAMVNIGSASDQIVHIAKVIEEIAFQTNILALNAAIEAARAGNAGKGFAVVADEVRNLAAKSAEAAKKTGELIRHSAEAVADGTELVAQTAKILYNIQGNDNRVNEIITEVHQASSEQVIAMEQIKKGLDQISSVVQTNAATAEENSAASEEMSSQAIVLHSEVGKFKLGASAKWLG